MAIFPCGYCKESFPSVQRMSEHIATNHMTELQRHDRNFSTGESSNFHCWPCDQTFVDERHLQSHIAETHRQSVDLDIDRDLVSFNELDNRKTKSRIPSSKNPKKAEPNVKSESTTPSETNSWKCEFCEKTFPFRSRLQRHLLRHKSTDQDRRHNCDLCCKKFFRSGDLWAHKKIHTRTKYECDQCHKHLASSGSLHNHRLAVHGGTSTRFQCDLCTKSFSLKHKLKSHKRIQHENEKPFRCHLCAKEFTQKQSLTSHLGTSHKIGEPTRCSMCSKPFYDLAYLRKHLRWHERVKKSRGANEFLVEFPKHGT